MGRGGRGIGRGDGTQEATNGESQDSMGLLFLLLCFVGQVGITAAGKRGANTRGPGRGRGGVEGVGLDDLLPCPLSGDNRSTACPPTPSLCSGLYGAGTRGHKGWLT